MLAMVVRLVWGSWLSTRLTTKLGEIRARGEPASPGDIDLEPVADADNAWLAYMRAADAVAPDVESPSQSAIEPPAYPPFGSEWEALAEASERANAAVFPLARSARQLTRSQLRKTADDASERTRYTDVRYLADVLVDGALYAHLRGRDGEAVERVLDALHLGQAIRQDPFAMPQLIGTHVCARAMTALQQMAPTLVVRASSHDAGAASDQQVRAVVATLLDETETRRWFPRAVVTERATMLGLLARQSGGTWATRPLAHQAALRWIEDFDVLVEASGQPTLAGAHRHLERLYGRTSGDGAELLSAVHWVEPTAPRYSRWFEEFGGPPVFARLFDQFFHDSAERRVTAVGLAAQLYRRDHGRWPDDLASLVPTYLSAVPTDPCLDGNRPLGYVLQRGVLPDGGDRPLVYFDPVEDAVADVIDPEPIYGWHADLRPVKRGKVRQYRDLALWLPTKRRFDEQRRSEAEAVDDDPEEADAPRDDAEQDGDADDPPKQ
jgi:hypothetical protein